jgi:hypothetical protein
LETKSPAHFACDFFADAAAVFVGVGNRIFVFDIIDGSLLLMINTQQNQNQVNRKTKGETHFITRTLSF